VILHLLLVALLAQAAPLPAAVIADPPRDAAHPASVAPLVIPSGGAAMNGLIYTASGAGPHPTLLLLHGFPGNEQNLDLAQAARRAGWNVVTMHYRGSWGSGGAFSFAHAAEDANAAVAYLLKPETAARFGIDPKRIAVAGHSMGGMMAARAVADHPQLLGAFLIDPWDIASTGPFLADPANVATFRREELDADMPPLSGTSAEALIDEIRHAGVSLDLAATVKTLGTRPLVLVYAEFGNGPDEAKRIEAAARAAGGGKLTAMIWPSDHSFSDRRIALAGVLVDWLGSLTPAK